MSYSRRTEPTRVIAASRFTRDRERRPVYPRVVERAPRPGDVHPLQSRHVRAFLRALPFQYVYGLRSVELRARTSEGVGQPYGHYTNADRAIVLYSVPPDVWTFPAASVRKSFFEMHGADVQTEGGAMVVRWNRPVDLAHFLYGEVLLHELGHHFHNQYRSKYKHPRTPAAKEASADRHRAVLAKCGAFSVWHEL